ncbi:hypothetical protein EV360DRAFT_68261 [Lentinula raphanica]|nr:hypothetical protein EV360DRAFT_68261 [Lentinula raphanica]
MRFQIIYAFYVAVTLLSAASVSARPMPVDGVHPEAAQTKKASVSMRIGLYDYMKVTWVEFDADQAVRLEAQYALCFGCRFCLFYVHTSGSEGYVAITTPKLLNSASTQLVAPASTDKRVDLDFYETIKPAVLSSRFGKEDEFRPFDNKLKEWIKSKSFSDGKSVVLDVLGFLHSDRSLCLPPGTTFDEAYDQTSTLLDTLKADTTNPEHITFIRSWATQRRYHTNKRKPKPMESGEPSSQPPVPINNPSPDTRIPSLPETVNSNQPSDKASNKISVQRLFFSPTRTIVALEATVWQYHSLEPWLGEGHMLVLGLLPDLCLQTNMSSSIPTLDPSGVENQCYVNVTLNVCISTPTYVELSGDMHTPSFYVREYMAMWAYVGLNLALSDAQRSKVKEDIHTSDNWSESRVEVEVDMNLEVEVTSLLLGWLSKVEFHLKPNQPESTDAEVESRTDAELTPPPESPGLCRMADPPKSIYISFTSQR